MSENDLQAIILKLKNELANERQQKEAVIKENHELKTKLMVYNRTFHRIEEKVVEMKEAHDYEIGMCEKAAVSTSLEFDEKTRNRSPTSTRIYLKLKNKLIPIAKKYRIWNVNSQQQKRL